VTGASVFHKNDGSIDYADLANELASMVHGYPYSDPPETLGWIAHELKADLGSRHGRAMMVAAWASRWYTKWKITDVTLFDDLIEAAARAGEVFDAAGCRPSEPPSGRPAGCSGTRPEERAPLALAVCHLADTWSPAAPGVVAVYREALQRFDLAPLDQPCPHPEGHPGIKARDIPRHVRAHISPLAEADEHGERCPHRVAERVRDVAAHTTEYLGIEADPL
jgi:hypothetical protein